MYNLEEIRQMISDQVSPDADALRKAQQESYCKRRAKEQDIEVPGSFADAYAQCMLEDFSVSTDQT